MAGKVVLAETFKHKYESKQKENERLLLRLEELSSLNGDLQYKILSKE